MRQLLLSIVVCVFLTTPAIGADVETAAAVLTWQAPTSNEDGTPLTDCCVYTVYWRAIDASAWEQGAPTTDTAYEVYNLERGKDYEFYVTATDTAGNESAPSNVVSARIPPGIDVEPPAPVMVDKCELVLTLKNQMVVIMLCNKKLAKKYGTKKGR